MPVPIICLDETFCQFVEQFRTVFSKPQYRYGRFRVERTHQVRQASRDDRFRQIAALREKGLSQRAIAGRVGMSERSVRTWLKRGAAPTWKRHFRRRSVFDPYAAYVLERWQAGVREGTQLYEEIRAQGLYCPPLSRQRNRGS